MAAPIRMIVRSVAEAAGTREVAGCGSIGVIAGGREFESGPSLAVMVVGGNTSRRRGCLYRNCAAAGAKLREAIAATVRPHLGATNLLCLFPDTYNLDPEPLIGDVRANYPASPSSAAARPKTAPIGETFQFCGDVVSSNAVSGMLLAGDFAIDLGAANACAPLGPTHRVTAVRDNIILELDDRRAWDVFAEAAGPLADDLARALSFVFIGVPLTPRQ